MKRDTAANWEQNNPVLLNGEIIIVDTASGEVRFKVGDGTKLYKQLPFSDEAVRALISEQSGAVRYDEQTLTADEQAQARKNIGAGTPYTLPIASPTQLGGVKPVAKTDAMTRSIGVDANGGLYTEPGAWYVTVTQTSSSPSTAATADKTPQEIRAAYQAGYAVYARVKFVGPLQPYILPLVITQSSTSGDDGIVLIFSTIGQAEGNSDAGLVAAVYMGGVWNVWITNLAKQNDIPIKTSELTNDSNFITFTELGNIDDIATV